LAEPDGSGRQKKRPSGECWLGCLGDAVQFEVEYGAALAKPRDLFFELVDPAAQAS
jgi:hypothetical protein